MSWKSNFTDRAEDALDGARLALRRRPTALTTAELLRAMDESGPSLARGVMTALDANVSEILARATALASERGAELPSRRFRTRPAALEMIIRRAVEEASLLGHRIVGSEHLLLAIISVHDDPTTCALREAGITQDTVRGTLRRLLLSWTDDGIPRPRVSAA